MDSGGRARGARGGAGARRDASDAYARVRSSGRELEAGLLALLFETPLVVLVREYDGF